MAYQRVCNSRKYNGSKYGQAPRRGAGAPGSLSDSWGPGEKVAELGGHRQGPYGVQTRRRLENLAQEDLASSQ